MADTEDLSKVSWSNLSAPDGNAGVDGVKVGETLAALLNGNAELRLVEPLHEQIKMIKI